MAVAEEGVIVVVVDSAQVVAVVIVVEVDSAQVAVVVIVAVSVEGGEAVEVVEVVEVVGEEHRPTFESSGTYQLASHITSSMSLALTLTSGTLTRMSRHLRLTCSSWVLKTTT